MIGQVIKHYRIDALIGEGGMGAVYRGTDLNLQRLVAMKVLHPQLMRDPGLRERFLSEARLQGRLNHPGIVSVFDFDLEAGLIVMELVNGIGLDDVIQNGGPMPFAVCVEIMRQILQAVGYAHNYRDDLVPGGIIHRDIKPSNVLIEQRPERVVVKVADFGIAKIAGDANSRTATGTKMGTLYYMSPEQIKSSRDVSPRSDIYSLGVTLFEMLTGRVPFNAHSEYELMNQIIQSPIPQLDTLTAGIPPALQALVERSTAKDPAARPPSCAQFEAELLQASHGQFTPATGYSTPAPGPGPNHSTAFATASRTGIASPSSPPSSPPAARQSYPPAQSSPPQQRTPYPTPSYPTPPPGSYPTPPPGNYPPPRAPFPTPAPYQQSHQPGYPSAPGYPQPSAGFPPPPAGFPPPPPRAAAPPPRPAAAANKARTALLAGLAVLLVLIAGVLLVPAGMGLGVGNVSAVFSPPPSYVFNPSVVKASAASGSAKVASTLALTNTGRGPISFVVQENEAWMELNPATGNIPAGQQSVLAINCSCDNAEPRKGQVTVLVQGVAPLAVPVEIDCSQSQPQPAAPVAVPGRPQPYNPNASSAAAAPSGRMVTQDELNSAVDFLNSWANAWQQNTSGNVSSYEAHYDRSFVSGYVVGNKSGMNYIEWMADKRGKGTRAYCIVITVSNPSANWEGNRLALSFDQRYQSNTYCDYGRKTLYLVSTGGGWKIVSESQPYVAKGCSKCY